MVGNVDEQSRPGNSRSADIVKKIGIVTDGWAG
jgi:hypothetical protein